MISSGHRNRNAARGAALISALSMLLLLTMLGTAYVGYMSLEQQESRLSVQSSRARYLADAGIYAAIGELQAAIRDNRVPETEYTFDVPLYMSVRGELQREPQSVTVRVSDESALININHVERAVLEALGVPRPAARRIRNELSAAAGSAGIQNWFANVQGLRTRGFVSGKDLARIKTDLMTVYTAADPEDPRNYININSAPPAVLAALFNLSEEEALGVAEKRPFRSWSDAVEKIGKDPAQYNVIANAEPNRAMPVELALSSRCFRLISTANLQNAFTTRRGMTKGVEAVVLLSDDGQDYEFRFWSETPAELTETMMAEGTGSEAAEPESGEASPEEASGEALEESPTDSDGGDADGAPAEGDATGAAPPESEDTPATAVPDEQTESGDTAQD